MATRAVDWRKEGRMNWHLTDRTDWPALLNQFDWVRAMVGVPQDPIYHAEGDVATHTRMAYEVIYAVG